MYSETKSIRSYLETKKDKTRNEAENRIMTFDWLWHLNKR